MRHGWTTVFRTLIVLGVGVSGLARHAAAGEPTDDRLGIRTVPILLLTRADVQKSLGLRPEQGTQCKRAAMDFYDRALRLRGRKDAGAHAARKTVDLQMTTWLSKFLSPEQLDRLEQIDLQWEGASAMLTRPMLDESLRLTPTQKTSITQCLEQGKAQRAQAGWSYENHVNQTRTAISLLDERQRNLWVHVLGPNCPFEITVEPRTAQSQQSPAPR